MIPAGMSASTAKAVPLVEYLNRLQECHFLISREVKTTQEALLQSVDVWLNAASIAADVQLSLPDLYDIRSALSNSQEKIGLSTELSQGTWKLTAELSDFFVFCCSKLASTDALLTRYSGI